MKASIFFLSALLVTQAWSLPQLNLKPKPLFSSATGEEIVVSFESEFVTQINDPMYFESYTDENKATYVENHIEPLMLYLFGPTVTRAWASPLKTLGIVADFSNLKMRDGFVVLPYKYTGTWIVAKNWVANQSFQIPVPFNTKLVFSPRWKRCTDSAPDHQTPDFYWYFWDPTRSGCDQKEGMHYQTVTLHLGAFTPQTQNTYAEFSRMIKEVDGQKTLPMTFAFGYVSDPARPNPMRDYDQGAAQFRYFLNYLESQVEFQWKVSPIFGKDYKNSQFPELQIGKRYEALWKGVLLQLNVVMSAGVDQMELFAESYGHDHDSLFSWFGHSRLGSGFDAEMFEYKIKGQPEYYSLSPNYQVIYWAGCNSYSYYTLPFFKMKAALNSEADPMGTKNLDILANGMPSYFSLNAVNAQLAFQHFISWEEPSTYQSLIAQIEAEASRMGIQVLATVLGDEDNPSR